MSAKLYSNPSIAGVLLMLLYSHTGTGTNLHTQDSTAQFVLRVNGYVKELPYLVFDKRFSIQQANQLIHQRLNIRLNGPSGFSAAAEFRTRWFWGDEVRNTPRFSQRLRNQNEQIDAGKAWYTDHNHTVFTNTERLWIEYKRGKWVARAGRQRINWGIAITWNPNDIFNAYNFLDFDYEERPGSDAILLRYVSNTSSELNLAISPSKSEQQQIAALRYFTNWRQYDLQLIAGKYHRDYTLGVGWAGNIEQTGFKGEVQYFISSDSKNAQCNALIESDYMFSDGWYLNAGFLWNSNGINKSSSNWYSLNFSLSARNLMPTEYNTLAGISKEITPLLTASFNTVYAPGTNILIALPSLRYNLSDHWDANIVWQAFFAELNDSFDAVLYQGFFRLKYSF